MKSQDKCRHFVIGLAWRHVSHEMSWRETRASLEAEASHNGVQSFQN